MSVPTPQIEGLHQAALTTADLERSTGLYRDVLGLSMIACFEPPGLAFFRLGNVRLSLQQVDQVEAASSVLYFRVPDVRDAFECLQAHSVETEQWPALVFRDDLGQFGEAGVEEWMAFFRDPDGHLLAFVSHKKP
jgi:catechol 2,3-dioxygenase-like lactoylglutathione lyase family enzyme